MQNTSGILPTTSSSANPTPAPTNTEPTPSSVVTQSTSGNADSSTSTTSLVRRIAMATPRSTKSTKYDSEMKDCNKTPIEIAVDVSPLLKVDAECVVDSLPIQTNKRRCWTCKGKIALSAVTCRCGYTFCNRHRYAEEHDCAFDFRRQAKRKLEEENPRVVPLKVARIN